MRTAAQGKKWILGSGAHSQWLGLTEIKKKILYERTIPQGSVVYDIGANVGIYTILSAVICGESGKVFAFEPDPYNIKYLEEHTKLNKLDNVSVVRCAVSNISGQTFFQDNGDHCTGHIVKEGPLKVETVSLDDFVLLNKNAPPEYLKIDVEGAEDLVLEGANKILNQYKPEIFLATHNLEVDNICRQILNDQNYNITKIPGYDDELYCVPIK